MATQQNDYITIAEYATRRGVSVSAVYKRLGGTLKQYYKVIDGKKYISVEALVGEGITPPVEAQGSPGAEENQEAQAEAPAEETAGTKAKPGFWGRLFGGKKK